MFVTVCSFCSLQFSCPVHCPMHRRVAIPIKEWRAYTWILEFHSDREIRLVQFQKTKLKGLQGLFKDEVEIKKLKLSVHFFLHSVYQCFSYRYLFSYKIFGTSTINSPNHNHFIYQESSRAWISRLFWDLIKKSSTFQGLHQIQGLFKLVRTLER